MQSLPYTGRRSWERNYPQVPDQRHHPGVAPYWRVALQHQWTGKYLEALTYGLAAEMFPDGVSGRTDRYTDLAFDLQYEQNFSGMVASRIQHLSMNTGRWMPRQNRESSTNPC